MRSVPSEIDGGEAVLAACRSAGVDVVFSSSGSEWSPVWEALARQDRDHTAGPRYVDLTHETLAVAMATGYGMVVGRPQIVLLHTVPGLLQGACGIHGAQLAGVGMVICSSESITYGEGSDDGGVDPGSQWYRNLSIVGGPQAIAAPFTKWSTGVGSVSTLYGSLVRAFEIARRPPAAPVYLNVPVEVLLQSWDPEQACVRDLPEPGRRVSTAPEIAAAAQRLINAERPVVITETSGRHEDGFAGLVDLAERLALPVIEPRSAVCANFPRHHELHVGGEADELIAGADLIVLLCCRAPWYPPSNRPVGATVLVIDDVVARPHMDYQVLGADQYLEGDIGPTLRALSTAVDDAGVDPAKVAARRVALAERPSRQADRITEPDRLRAAETIDVMAELIHPQAVVVDETITHSRLVAARLAADAPDRYVYVQGGLGQGMGVALGVKMARPEREVVLTIGDGSFLYNPVVQALTAARTLALPLLIVVLNNHQYRSMKMNHLRFYPHGVAVADENFRGVDLSDQPNIADLATPFGMFGVTVTDRAELYDAISKGLVAVRSGTTAIIDVHVAS